MSRVAPSTHGTSAGFLCRLLGASGDPGESAEGAGLSFRPVRDTGAELRSLRERPPPTVIASHSDEDGPAIEFLGKVADSCPQVVRILATPRPVENGVGLLATKNEVAAGIVQLPSSRVGIWGDRVASPVIPPLHVLPPSGHAASKPVCWLCEDDADYRLLIGEAWSAAHPHKRLRAFVNVDGLLAALDAPMNGEYPALLLLDLNLPGRTGLDLLAELQRNEGKHRPRVCVFTSATADTGIMQAFSTGADSYFVKPISFATMKAQMTVLGHLWLPVDAASSAHGVQAASGPVSI